MLIKPFQTFKNFVRHRQAQFDFADLCNFFGARLFLAAALWLLKYFTFL